MSPGSQQRAGDLGARVPAGRCAGGLGSERGWLALHSTFKWVGEPRQAAGGCGRAGARAGLRAGAASCFKVTGRHAGGLGSEDVLSGWAQSGSG